MVCTQQRGGALFSSGTFHPRPAPSHGHPCSSTTPCWDAVCGRGAVHADAASAQPCGRINAIAPSTTRVQRCARVAGWIASAQQPANIAATVPFGAPTLLNITTAGHCCYCAPCAAGGENNGPLPPAPAPPRASSGPQPPPRFASGSNQPLGAPGDSDLGFVGKLLVVSLVGEDLRPRRLQWSR